MASLCRIFTQRQHIVSSEDYLCIHSTTQKSLFTPVLPAASTVQCAVSNSEAWLHAFPVTFPLCISMRILKTNWLDAHHVPGTAGASGSELLYSTQYFHLLPLLSLVSLKQLPAVLAIFTVRPINSWPWSCHILLLRHPKDLEG